MELDGEKVARQEIRGAEKEVWGAKGEAQDGHRKHARGPQARGRPSLSLPHCRTDGRSADRKDNLKQALDLETMQLKFDHLQRAAQREGEVAGLYHEHG
jgi:hypothetical protein